MNDSCAIECELLLKERRERIEADQKHDAMFAELRTLLANQTRTLGLVVAAVTLGLQMVERFLK